MTNNAALGCSVQYSGSVDSVRWEGRMVDDRERFSEYLRSVVGPRVEDAESSFEAEIRALATTGMATEFVEHLLTSVPEPAGWEVGEALAECVLESECGHDICWPWNTVRDRRTPRASLPGTDLVGFCRQEQSALLVFGEVKTSSEMKAPPSVMSGGSGMTWQLEKSAKRLDIQRTLLQWLHARCANEPFRSMYEQAVGRFLKSQGKELLIFGVLIRDTEPNVADFEIRGRALAKELQAPTRTELIAWYLPVPIAEWPTLLQEAGS